MSDSAPDLSQVAEPKKIVCPQCGYVNESDATTCDRCSVDFAWARIYYPHPEKYGIESLAKTPSSEVTAAPEKSPNYTKWMIITCALSPLLVLTWLLVVAASSDSHLRNQSILIVVAAFGVGWVYFALRATFFGALSSLVPILVKRWTRNLSLIWVLTWIIVLVLDAIATYIIIVRFIGFSGPI